MSNSGKARGTSVHGRPLAGASYEFKIDAQTVIMGATLGLFSSAMVLHFHGWVAAGVFIVAVMASQVWVGFEMKQVHVTRRKHAVLRAFIANLTLITSWTVGALALFATGNGSGRVAAMAMMMTLAFHVIFSASRKRMVSLVLVAIPGVALLYFMIAAAWAEYSLPIAICATIASFGTLLGLYSAWTQSQRNTDRMQSAIDEASAVRKRLEFAIEAAGEGYFEVDFADMLYRPNPQLAKSLGWQPGPKDMGRLNDLVHPESREEAFGS